MPARRLFAPLMLVLACASAVEAQELVTLQPRPGVVQVYFLASAPREPQAVAVLTATMFRPAGRRAALQGPGLSGFDFSSVRAPLLLVHHREDACVVTPYSDAARLSSTYPLISVSGGPRRAPARARRSARTAFSARRRKLWRRSSTGC